jgi:hypothetical protein
MGHGHDGRLEAQVPEIVLGAHGDHIVAAIRIIAPARGLQRHGEGTNMATTPFTLVGNSADSPALFLRLSPATGHAAEILDVLDSDVGYDAAKFPDSPGFRGEEHPSLSESLQR